MIDSSNATVFIVDDDDAVRKSLSVIVETIGLQFRTFGTAQEFLDSYNPNVHGCLI